MRERILFSFLILLFVVSLTLSAPQTASTAQVGAKSTPPQPKWTEMDRQQLLAKGRLGDAGSQMWIGAAYEQGWFGKTNFHEAAKWFRRAAAQGDPDAQNSLGQMYEDGEGVQTELHPSRQMVSEGCRACSRLGRRGSRKEQFGLALP
jgi:TPR repeat protein